MRHIHTISILFISIILFSTSFAQAARGVELKMKEELNHKSGKLGEYRALVIGIDNYQDHKIPALKTAVNDAKEMGDLLRNMYGFKVTLLLDRQATRRTIIQTLRDFTANTMPDESILIYYAGHGEIDRVLNDGWWVPVDAIGGDSSTYLDNTVIQKVMRSMKARHILLISDSCYSGTLFGEARSMPSLIDDRYYLNLYNEKSRWGITSGNKTPVSDSGSEGHSIFAYQLIKALKKNENPYVTTQEIFSRIAPIIANNSEQQPLCCPVRDTGDQGGGFVFVSTIAASSTANTSSFTKKSNPKPNSEELMRQKEDLEREKQELDRERQEIDGMEALQTERKKLEAERVRLADRKKQLAMVKPTTDTAPSYAMKSEPKPNSEALMRQKESRESQKIEKMAVQQNERKKPEAESDILVDKSKQLAMVKPPTLSKYLAEIGRDGRFIAYDNGTVLDTGSGLMWASKDNEMDVEDYGATLYCKNFRGGGYKDWRMPTTFELAGLFDSNKKIITSLIKITKCCPWPRDYGIINSSGIPGSGDYRWTPPPTSYSSGCWRALPVRSESIE